MLVCPFLQQISMSATTTMVAVHKPAPTQLVHFSAAVTLGLDWTVTEELAVVSAYHGTVLYHRWILRLLTCIIALSHLPPSFPPSLPPFLLPSSSSSLQPLTNVQKGHTTVLSSAPMMEEAFAAAAMLGSSWVQMEPAVQVCAYLAWPRDKWRESVREFSFLQHIKNISNKYQLPNFIYALQAYHMF